MDPLTHLLTGATLARTGLNRRAAYATVAMALAAEMPDIDYVWWFAGPVALFQHHRGITHTFVGIPFEAAALTLLFYGIHRWRIARGAQTRTQAPTNWLALWLLCLLGLASHLLLDWTNNYGVRPFFPFNPHWYAGSFVFIVDPIMLLLLAAALILPGLLALINGEIGARRQPFPARTPAVLALLGIVILWSVRATQRNRALEIGAGTYPAASRLAANPDLLSPFAWHVIAELPSAFQLAAVDTRRHTLTATPDDLFYKPPTTLYTLPAKRSPLGEAYLDWSAWPLVTDIGLDGDGLDEVTFRDLRYLYDTPLQQGREHPPLAGTIFLDQDRRIKAQEINGREQR